SFSTRPGYHAGLPDHYGGGYDCADDVGYDQLTVCYRWWTCQNSLNGSVGVDDSDHRGHHVHLGRLGNGHHARRLDVGYLGHRVPLSSRHRGLHGCGSPWAVCPWYLLEYQDLHTGVAKPSRFRPERPVQFLTLGQ